MLKQHLFLLLLFLILPCELESRGSRGGGGSRGGFRSSVSKGFSKVKTKIFGGGRKTGDKVAPQPYKPSSRGTNLGGGGQRRPPPPRSWQGPPPRTWNTGFDQRRYGYRSTGYGPGTYSSSRVFRDSFMGSLTGYLAFSAGRAIIRNAMGPFSYHGRSYYTYGRPNHNPYYTTCSIPFNRLYENTTVTEVQEYEETPVPLNKTALAEVTPEVEEADDSEDDYDNGNGTMTARRRRQILNQYSSPEQILRNAQFEDGTRPKHLTWQCQSRSEMCCGTDCCPRESYYSDDRTTYSKGFLACALIVLAVVFCFVADKIRNMTTPPIIGASNLNTGGGAPPPTQVIYTPVPQNPGAPGYPTAGPYPPQNCPYPTQPPPPGFVIPGGQQPPPYPSAY